MNADIEQSKFIFCGLRRMLAWEWLVSEQQEHFCALVNVEHDIAYLLILDGRGARPPNHIVSQGSLDRGNDKFDTRLTPFTLQKLPFWPLCYHPVGKLKPQVLIVLR